MNESANHSDVLPIAAVIVNWNGGLNLDACVASLQAQRRGPAEIVVLDNGSSDGSPARISVVPSVAVIYAPKNLGFAGGANAGAAETQAPLLLFLNPDVTFESDALEALVTAVDDDPGLGIVGPVLLNADGTLQNWGLAVDFTCHPTNARSPSEPFFVAGCAFLVRRSLFHQLRGFDESYFMFAEDLDLCWRAQLSGACVRVIPEARALHEGGASMPGGYVVRGQLNTTARRIYLRERNTLAAVITNFHIFRAISVASSRIALGLVEAAVFCARREPAVALAYLRAFAWSARRLPTLARKRRVVQGMRTVRDRDLVGVSRGLAKLAVVREDGLPGIERAGRRH